MFKNKFFIYPSKIYSVYFLFSSDFRAAAVSVSVPSLFLKMLNQVAKKKKKQKAFFPPRFGSAHKAQETCIMRNSSGSRTGSCCSFCKNKGRASDRISGLFLTRKFFWIKSLLWCLLQSRGLPEKPWLALCSPAMRQPTEQRKGQFISQGRL